MQRPLQIAFHGVPHSAAVESSIREHTDKLEAHHPRMTSCRVVVEAPHRHHKRNRSYCVRVDVAMPGKDAIARSDPAQGPEHDDVYVAIRDAFEATDRALKERARRRHHYLGNQRRQPHAWVVHLEPDLEFGRLETPDGREVYFHRNSVIGGIDHLTTGDEVGFSETQGREGPQASAVALIGANGHHQDVQARRS